MRKKPYPCTPVNEPVLAMDEVVPMFEVIDMGPSCLERYAYELCKAITIPTGKRFPFRLPRHQTVFDFG